MCEVVSTFLATLGTGATATATGATATAATAATGFGATLQGLGTALAIAGPVVQGIQANRAAKETAAALERQEKTTAVLNSIEDQRARRQFRREIAAQRAGLVANGVALDSPTAVFLGETAAREMAFASASVRQTGMAEREELTTSARLARARGRQSMFKGGFSAAASLLSKAPDLWPELVS